MRFPLWKPYHICLRYPSLNAIVIMLRFSFFDSFLFSYEKTGTFVPAVLCSFTDRLLRAVPLATHIQE